MTKWCHVENGNLIDIVEIDPALIYPADYAATFEEISDNIDGSYIKNSDGNFIVKTVTEVTPPAPPRELTESEFLALCTRAERQGFTAARSSNADFGDFMTMLEKTGRTLVSSDEGKADIAAFVEATIISQATADAILGN